MTKRRDKSTTQKIKVLDAHIDAINTIANVTITVFALIKETKSPFTDKVMKVKVFSKFKLPSQFGMY